MDNCKYKKYSKSYKFYSPVDQANCDFSSTLTLVSLIIKILGGSSFKIIVVTSLLLILLMILIKKMEM